MKLAHSIGVSRHLVARLWRARYRRAVTSAFRTVPLYRERWALDGRTDPVLVAGRTGRGGGAVPVDEALHRLADLVPLAGGPALVDPTRGLRPVLAACGLWRRGTSAFFLDPQAPPPAGEVADALRRGVPVVAAGSAKLLAGLVTDLPRSLADRLRAVPCPALDELSRLDGPGRRKCGHGGLLHGGALGFLGGIRDCGRWHLDWPRVYARATDAGLAFTLLRQRSPRMVDVLVAGGVPGQVQPCPEHGTPTVAT